MSTLQNFKVYKTKNNRSTFIRLKEDEYQKLLEIKLTTGLSFPQIFKRAFSKIKFKQSIMSDSNCREIMRELNRIGVNINQIARKLNSGVSYGWNDDIKNIEHDMRKMKEVIAEYSRINR